MTPALRRSHRIIWLVLAVVLPIGLAAALYVAHVYMPPQPVTLPLITQPLHH